MLEPEILKPLFHLGVLMLGFLCGRLCLLAVQLHAQFGYTWEEAFSDALRLLFDTSL